MRRKVIKWIWEDPAAQQAFAEWVGFPSATKTKKEVNKIEKLLHIKPPLKMLDLGCGTGRQSIELARRGYEVVGIDVAKDYLKQARKEAKCQKLDIKFRLQRGSELKEKNTFDFILAYDHTLGFMSKKELNLHLRKIWKALKSQGKFLLKTAGPQLIPGKEFKRTKDWIKKDGKFILSDKYIKKRYRIENFIVVDTKKNEIIEYHEKQKAFSFNDIKSLLKKAGFRKVDCFKDLDGNKTSKKEFGVYICYK